MLRLLLASSIALAFVPPVPPRNGDPQLDAELAEAKVKFTRTDEKECREATETCVRKNNVDAVELMLEVLRLEHDRGSTYLSTGHYRDVVWGGLVRITDPYARQKVEAEVKTNKSNARARQWCAEVLGEYGDAAFGDTLVKALNDKELEVQRAAARALGKTRYPGAVKALTAQSREKDPYLRANAIGSLAQIEKDAQKPTLAKALADKDAGVRCALLGIAYEVYGDESEAWSIAALQDDDWRPRIQAVDNLGKIRTKTSVDALIDAAGRPDRAIVVARAVRHLQALTNQKHRSADAWKAWWKINRESFGFSAGSGPTPVDEDELTVSYHGIKLDSDHAAFLIDVSDEMKLPLKSKQVIKADAARKELEDALSKLHERMTFNAFAYAESVRAFEEKGPVELDAKTQKKVLEFFEKAPYGNRKDVWRALEQVIVDPTLDTAFVLSSGEPDVGLYVHWNRVTWHLKELNRFQKVVVHTIAYSDNSWHREQIEKIAEATGGEYRWFE
jgi:hypothetical protein